ncbi:bifunctional diaminohydroxyphosphoribosylaminopyrimidine deaminase/5-amino-6-(5-phosphoribosylamino)uracil reductase RibD [Cellvibrio japonicus]|uniref:Riboflavin biosynthesis protein RibD n=1 Tax=Cellvibrio japonicus (strain Ueda107) TaxID=498211 RepID=B3PBD1_CELJU|nr:bifunctional diaminohydroxyphosphoribosylaminopyrimidine deaminase/5-amino-6-(5-phosphoribosylamino)uracil reductase RibD [Cellvibrio japonicus]ACE83295.1 riboflavin biosynthesis protein RibD [Cellvibrio japonicus Ueda107]QEI13057.1 bifunctional diaminohydroxyphosphoribosylaminopyrimidine deaminase/5-amino-6-(5-phosphoribosylamino)uracil reductase RibD [Cellvibrio japonicus]QEI16631.1 bifunctional diaminohydroxyphosphoribosylaminopyrimidine deaminase/5-amino-6-(5-phosphoribosylamino)uracil re
MALTRDDHRFMARALRLAERGLYTTMPNPRVGCVLVKNQQIIAEGWHVRAGEGHAEVNALRIAAEQARGATAYVTLEPCNHTGKTGPCSQALIDAGVARVVYAMEDPNPLVSGRGLERLAAAGIEVDGPLFEEQARALNPGFITRMERKRPLLRCKMAMSLDGRTAMASGESKWITSPKARADVQRLRAASCAIVTGIGSVLQDNSQLTLRARELGLPRAEDIARRQPLRVILDSRLQLPRDALIMQTADPNSPELVPGPILLVHNGTADGAQLDGWPAHVELLALPGRDGRIDLEALVRELAQRQCNEVLIEAGATLAGAFLRRGLLDEVVVYMAPKLLGSQARPLFELPLETMSASLALKITDMRALGQDWRITAVPDVEY